MKYISRLYMVVEADSEAEAADAMSAMLSENLMMGGHLVNWAYSSVGGVYDHPTEIPHKVIGMGCNDMDMIFHSARHEDYRKILKEMRHEVTSTTNES